MSDTRIPLRPTKPKDDEDYEDLIFWVTGSKAIEEQKPPEKAFEAKLFEEYYKKQGIVSDDKEADFSSFIKRPLPLSLRFHGLYNDASALMQALRRDYFTKLAKAGPATGVVEPPQCIEWYPEERAWRMELDQKLINDNRMLKEMTHVIQEEVDAGYLSAQEVASMLPVLLLDIKPHHKILDMRAAPGDKSLQILELLHSNSTDLLQPTGFLLCSETHIKQCNKLLTRFNRCFSPNFALVNMDANALPEVFLPNAEGLTESIFYDRVLCDLPSSGDGMFRKNLDGLRCWTPSSPLTQHPALIKLLHSGLGGLGIGGELVFSTHSMNPVESEAVVHTILVQQKGTVELVDISDRLPNIVHSLGIDNWQVMTKGPRWFKSYAEVPEHYLNTVPDSTFPPEGEEEQIKKFNLNRCIRIMPYDQNTAGLFVAVLRRTGNLYEAWVKEQEEIAKAWEAAEAERLAKEEEERKRLEEEERKKKEEEEEQKRKEEEERQRLEEEKKKKEEEKEKGELGTSEEAGEKEGEILEEKEQKMDVSEVDASVDKEEKKTPDEKNGKHSKDDKEENKDKKEADKSENKDKKEAKSEKEKKDEKSKKTDDAKRSEADRSKDRKRKEESGRGDNERKKRLEEEREEWKQKKSNKEEENQPDKEKKKREGSLETPYIFMADDSPIWSMISSFYGISGGFPHTRLASQLVLGKPRSLYLVSESMKQLILLNQSIIAFLHVGVRMFFVYESARPTACQFQLAQEGLLILLPYLNEDRLVLVSKKDLLALLSNHSASVDSLAVKTQQQLSKMAPGGCVFLFQMEAATRRKAGNQLAISGWKDDIMCRTFLTANQRHHYHRIAGGNPKEIDVVEADCTVHTAMSQFVNQFSLVQSAN